MCETLLNGWVNDVEVKTPETTQTFHLICSLTQIISEILIRFWFTLKKFPVGCCCWCWGKSARWAIRRDRTIFFRRFGSVQEVANEFCVSVTLLASHVSCDSSDPMLEVIVSMPRWGLSTALLKRATTWRTSCATCIFCLNFSKCLPRLLFYFSPERSISSRLQFTFSQKSFSSQQLNRFIMKFQPKAFQRLLLLFQLAKTSNMPLIKTPFLRTFFRNKQSEATTLNENIFRQT